MGKRKFIKFLSDSSNNNGGSGGGAVSNTLIKEKFGTNVYTKLEPIINELLGEQRVKLINKPVVRDGVAINELCYTLLNDEEASKLKGLDVNTMMVYHCI